jgi:hypothetical protein
MITTFGYIKIDPNFLKEKKEKKKKKRKKEILHPTT